MPKLKSHSGAKKRFKVTARGKVLHKPAGARHLLIGMSRNRGRRLRKQRVLCRTDAKMIAKLIPYAN